MYSYPLLISDSIAEETLSGDSSILVVIFSSADKSETLSSIGMLEWLLSPLNVITTSLPELTLS